MRCERHRTAGVSELLLKGLNFDVHAGWQIQLHQRVHGLLCRLKNVDEALVRANLERLARLLVHVRRTQHAVLVLHRRQRNRSRHLRARPLRRLDNLARRRVQHAVVVSLQPDSYSLSNHLVCSFSVSGSLSRMIRFPAFRCYLIISEIVPAPTVRPPSRMAKRRPFSMATGVISSTSSSTLSPGITISVPAGKVATPVTSVVRK